MSTRLLYAIATVLMFILSKTSFGPLAVLAWLCLSVFLLIKKIKTNKRKSSATEMPDGVKQLKFTHFCNGTGIAVDPDKRELHLKSKSNYKVYPFSEVREWESNLSTGQIVGGGFHENLFANAAQHRNNIENTGLFVKVRDIDHPVWKINFPLKTAKQDLARWMEILQQTLNEAKA